MSNHLLLIYFSLIYQTKVISVSRYSSNLWLIYAGLNRALLTLIPSFVKYPLFFMIYVAVL